MIFPFGWVESQISILYFLVVGTGDIAVQQNDQSQKLRVRLHETNASLRR